MKVFISQDEAKLHKVSVDRIDDVILLRCSNKKVAKKMKDAIKTFLIANTMEDDDDDDEPEAMEGSKKVTGLSPDK